MTRLLVSVRSLQEARQAAEAGVDLIDLKEPRRGALGRVSLDLATAVSELLGPAARLSMALGELVDWSDDDWNELERLPPGIAFAKIGLAGCAAAGDWQARWRRALKRLPKHTAPVAVVYADWRLAGAAAPAEILALAALNGCRALLVDTWSKDRGDVFCHLDNEALSRLFQEAKESRLTTVLAGSLRLETIDAALGCRPDYIAVRGAVCRDAREGDLCPEKLLMWVKRSGTVSNRNLKG